MSKQIQIYEVDGTNLLYIVTDINLDAVSYDKNYLEVEAVDGYVVIINNGSGFFKELPSDFVTPLESSVVDLVEIIQGYINNTLPEVGDSLITNIDEDLDSPQYIGKSAMGKISSESSWQIQRITVVSNITSILFADGDDLFDNIWDDRATLTYA